MTSLSDRPDCFPLPRVALPSAPQSASRRIRQRFARRLLTIRYLNGSISALNSLSDSCLVSDSLLVSQSYETKSQGRMLASLYNAASNFSSRLEERDGDADLLLGYRSISYNEGFPRMDAKLVSLPAKAATADLLSLLPDDMAARYSSPDSILRPGWRDAVRKKVRLLPGDTSEKEWLCLVRRLQGRGMVSFTRDPQVVNGVFVVPKGDQQRFIVNAVPLNDLSLVPEKVVLPTPDVISSLELDPDQDIFMGKSDRDSFYHRLKVPEWLAPFLALPPVPASEFGLGEGLIYPCCATLPMGWSHSVLLAQSAHEHQISLSGAFPPRSLISKSADRSLNRFRYLVYIDDVGAFCPCCVEGRERMSVYNSHMAGVGLPCKQSKEVLMSSEPLELLGLLVSRGYVGVSPANLMSLASSTRALLRKGSCSPEVLESLVGSWVWAMLPRRPALAVLSQCYRFLASTRGSAKLWPSVKRELQCVIGLVPLLHTTWSLSVSNRLVASDASSTGLGVASTVVQSEEVSALDMADNGRFDVSRVVGRAQLMYMPALESWVDRKWSTIVSAPVRFPQHINVLEAAALLLALRWVASLSNSHVSRKLILLIDSSVVFFSLRKGRSSSPKLLRILRRISALLLAMSIVPVPVWVPSHLNPADAPSRGQVG